MKTIIVEQLRELNNEELVELYQTTESNYLQDDILTQLLYNNEGLMVKIADKYRNIPNIDWVDRRGELNIALLRAVKDFKVELGFKFITLLRKYCIQAMDKQYEIQTRGKRFNAEMKLSSYEVMLELQKDGGEEIELELENDSYADFEFIHYIKSLPLSDNEMKVCFLLGKGESKSDIARMLGVSPTMITKYMKKIRSQMVLA